MMKTLCTIILFGCLFVNGISQTPEKTVYFDKNELNEKARYIIDTLEYHQLNYPLKEAERSNLSYQLKHFIIREASFSDIKMLVNYPDPLYSKIAYDRSFSFGCTSIDLLQHLAHGTEKDTSYLLYNYSYKYTFSGQPSWTRIGSYVHTLEGLYGTRYNETSENIDSTLEFLCLYPNKLTRMKAHYLMHLENNPQHIAWATELRKREGFYIAAIPLMKYCFEEEKELILQILKTWLFEAKDSSIFRNYLSLHFDDVFSTNGSVIFSKLM